jgi:hypothetical protein
VVAGLSVTLVVVVVIAAGVGTWRAVDKGVDGVISLSEPRESQQ